MVFPASFNVYDSLAEAYMKKGNKELAIESYRKSLELNPDNVNALEKLRGQEGDRQEVEESLDFFFYFF